ncbi:MAG TPA: recombination mediator RecR [Planctomycetota bacterium]|nr:recombination mediator RecR [Planctomycetota bacterium]
MKTPIEPIERVIDELGKLPGIGRRSAERMAYHLLAASEKDAMALAVAIRDLKKRLHPCRVCGAVTDGDLCVFCSDPDRDRSAVCVVESQRDALALDETGAYRGLFHVLGGRLSPTAGTGPEQLSVEPLLARLDGGEIREVILATNPDLEGDGTAAFLAEMVERRSGAKISRLARGLSSGGQIELAGRDSLGAALANRQPLRGKA